MYCIIEKKVVPLQPRKIHSINPLKIKDYGKNYIQTITG